MLPISPPEATAREETAVANRVPSEASELLADLSTGGGSFLRSLRSLTGSAHCFGCVLGRDFSLVSENRLFVISIS